jgi:glutathione S-transferase
MIHVYHLINSRSQRVIWLLEELGLEYEIIFCSRDQKTGMVEKDLEKIHPLGKAPIIRDQTTHDITLAETAAIFDYLLEQYGDGKLVPQSGSVEKVFYYYWKQLVSALPEETNIRKYLTISTMPAHGQRINGQLKKDNGQQYNMSNTGNST